MIYYLVQRLCSFNDSIEVDGVGGSIAGLSIKLAWPDDYGSPKFYLPVFETREEAEGWSEDGKYPVRTMVRIEQEYIEEPSS